MSTRQTLLKILIVLSLILFFQGFASADYDVILSGVQKFDSPVTYSNKSIYVAGDGFVEYSEVTFENCIVDVNGFIEFSSNVLLDNSIISVKGSLKANPGIVFDEIGASSIIATGDSVRSGKINIEGSMVNRIKVFSDNIISDSEFIIIDSDSSSNSTLKYVDFFGGWCNVQIYNKRLSEAISNCRFYGADFGVYQNGIDELTDIRFSLFYWNYISLYLEQEGSLNNETECLIDNVVIDNQFEENSYGIIISGLQTTPDFSLMNLTNTIITNSYVGWYIDNSSFYPPSLSNLAYHGNSFG